MTVSDLSDVRPTTTELYVFGVVDGRDDNSPVATVAAQLGLSARRVGRVAAVCEPGRGPDPRDDVAVIAAARRHDALLQAIAEVGPVLPVRLGITCRSDLLDRVLGAEQDQLQRELDRIRGRHEWRLKVTGRQPPAETASEAASGTDYLRAKADAVRAARRPDEAAQAVFASLDEQLRPLAIDADEVKVNAGAAAVRARSYLVPDAQETALMRTADAVSETAHDVDVTLIGPLPAYSFVTVRLEVRDE